MGMATRWLVYFVLFFNMVLSHAAPQSDEWFSHDASGGVVLNVDLFISSTCPHCHKADDFFRDLSEKNLWIKTNRHVIDIEKPQLKLFYQKLQAFHSNDFSVPAIMFCDSRWVGFLDSETTGKGLLRALTFCHHQVEKDGALTEVTRNTLRQWSASNQSNLKMEIKQPASLLASIVSSALMEAISPCSLFCLLMFLSFLWLYPDRREVRFYLGLMFILTLGALHTAQFVFTNAYQQWMLYLRWVSWISGVALLAFVVQYYNAQRRSGRQRSIFWIVPVLLLGVATVYSYQQTCDFSVGAMFQQWLQTKTLTSAAYYFCQLTYLVVYLLPLVLLLIFYLIFNVHPRKILPVSACLMLAAMGVLLLAYPSALSILAMSGVVFIAALFVGWRYSNYSPHYDD